MSNILSSVINRYSSVIMLKNYFTVALRSLLKYKGYSAINLLGLTAGITTCVLIYLYIQHELSYDRFHEQADRIYRVDNTYLAEGVDSYPTVSSALAVGAKETIPDVEEAVRISRLGSGLNSAVVIQVEDEFYREQQVYFADPSFFQLFSFPLIEGNAVAALAEPFSAVLTEETVKKYFGRTDVVGQSFRFASDREHEYQVTGVTATSPTNSHFTFSILTSTETVASLNPDTDLASTWNNDGWYTYLLLKGQSSPNEVVAQIDALNAEHLSSQDIARKSSLTALTDIHLHSNMLNEVKPNGSMAQVYVFMAIALFVLFIAVVNYMNLATARSARRSKEVGLRKTLGAERWQLIGQFLSESVLLVLIATLVSLLLAQLLLPTFNQLAGKELALHLDQNFGLWQGLMLVVLLTGLVSGSYPALFLSGFKPAEVLKGKLAVGMNSSPWLRKGLVVFQFMVSIVLIIGAWVVYSQIDYLKNKDLGFQKEHVVVIENDNNAVTAQLSTFKRELTQHPGVLSAAASLSVPGGLRPIVPIKTDQMGEEEQVNMAAINIDFEYLQTMGIEVATGRDFDPRFTTDSTQSIIINRQAIKELNLVGEPVGQTVRINLAFPDKDYQEKRIIGVVDDINFEPLYRATAGAFFAPLLPVYNYVFVKINPQEREEALHHLENTWTAMVPDQPFTFSFLDDDLNQLYQAEEKLSTIVTYFSGLAVIIACLGLFGLASFATEQRRKEIGIRKVLGSTNVGIIRLFFKEYLQIIAIANLVAWPLAYLLTKEYMSNFVFSTQIQWFIFLVAGGLVLSIALLTVGAKAVKAAMANPVKSLRSE
ncbi:ABC transporter permease [Tunicatimonas pelagia]|uniref:ABC transporter permease n=1 Tax=Tunicatimonas pelagia TaxID=931531 RepID=UPI002665E3F0|nr:ABC transporter permease [Tunicatimonas pelagia]WKN41097.1 ABC transporter permease [Tunicatimonas pelagia]